MGLRIILHPDSEGKGEATDVPQEIAAAPPEVLEQWIEDQKSGKNEPLAADEPLPTGKKSKGGNA